MGFEVSAIPSPRAEPKIIGHISLTTQLTRSKFGDEELFFKHQLMEEDFGLHPEWLDEIDKKEECGMDAVSTTAPVISNGCHSPLGLASKEGMLSSDADLVV